MTYTNETSKKAYHEQQNTAIEIWCASESIDEFEMRCSIQNVKLTLADRLALRMHHFSKQHPIANALGHITTFILTIAAIWISLSMMVHGSIIGTIWLLTALVGYVFFINSIAMSEFAALLKWKEAGCPLDY